jgi:hypothetical protein
MRYKISEIEDQLIATLRADTTNLMGVNVDTFAGQVSSQMFYNPEYMQSFLKILPFCLVSYQGRVGNRVDSAGKDYEHLLTFRFFVGSQSLRSTQEAVRGCYDILAALYDDVHAKIVLTSPQQLSTYTALSGTALSSSGVHPLSPFFEAGGQDERIVVNVPGIVVFSTDYTLRILA